MNRRRQINTTKVETNDLEKDIPYDPSIGAKMIANYEKEKQELEKEDDQVRFTIANADNNIGIGTIDAHRLSNYNPLSDKQNSEFKHTEEYLMNTGFFNKKEDLIVPKYIPKKKETTFVFNDLQAENKLFFEEINKRWNEVLKSGEYLFGKQTTEFEESFAKITGSKYCVSVKNNTDAVIILLRHVLSELPDATVILPDYGSYSIATAVKNCTNNICFVPVDESLTIDVKKLPENIKNGIIIPSNLFGNNCNIKIIKRYAISNNHIIIEDCSHSTGSVSSITGDYGIFSFSADKPLGTIGYGAAICMQDNSSYKKLMALRNNGIDNETGLISELGINSFMGEMQAAVLNAKLDKFENPIEKRRAIVSRYKKIIDGIRVNSNCVYQQFVMLFNDRDKIIEELKKENIPYQIPYEHHISDMPLFFLNIHDIVFRVNDKIISLPCHAFMNEDEITKVEKFLTKHKEQEFIA